MASRRPNESPRDHGTRSAEALRPLPRTAETVVERLHAALAARFPCLRGSTRTQLARVPVAAAPAGACLFRTGDALDGAVLVLSGALVLRHGETRSRIGPGALVNPGALLPGLGDHIATSTLVARRHTRFAWLRRKELASIAPTTSILDPEIAWCCSAAGADGAVAAADDAFESRCIALLSLTTGLDLNVAQRRILRNLELKPVARASWVDPEVSRMRTMERIVRNTELTDAGVLLALDADDPDQLRFALEEADQIVFMTSAGERYSSPDQRRLLWSMPTDGLQCVHLVRVHQDMEGPARGLAWSRHALVDVVHNVRQGSDEGWARLGRMLSGTARGVVLNGRSAGLWSNLGMLQALEARDLEPDVICATGQASSLARLYARIPDAALTEDYLRSAMRNPRDLLRRPTREEVQGRLLNAWQETAAKLDDPDGWIPCFTDDETDHPSPEVSRRLLGLMDLWCPPQQVVADRSPDASGIRGAHEELDLGLTGYHSWDLRAVREIARKAKRRASRQLDRMANR